MGKHSWKRFRPQSNEEIELLLKQERKLTAQWYARVSGVENRSPANLYPVMDEIAGRINTLLREKFVEDFAKLEW